MSHFLVEASQEDMGACDSCQQFSANRAIMVTFQDSMGSEIYGTETTRVMPGCSGFLWHEGWCLDGSSIWKLEPQKFLLRNTRDNDPLLRVVSSPWLSLSLGRPQPWGGASPHLCFFHEARSWRAARQCPSWRGLLGKLVQGHSTGEGAHTCPHSLLHPHLSSACTGYTFCS